MGTFLRLYRYMFCIGYFLLFEGHYRLRLMVKGGGRMHEGLVDEGRGAL